MKYFLEHNNKKYSNFDLIKAFENLGIKKGDILCVHTELFNFGIPLLPRNEFLQTIIDCFFEVIGKEGTLIMPTFTYSFCKNEVYDKLNSPTKMGALNEYFRKRGGVKRTNDPIFSFAIKGAKQDLFLKDTKSCFGENCVYEILTQENGKLINFGDTLSFTYFHYPEEYFGIYYRYNKIFKGLVIDENRQIYKKSINFYVRKENLYPDTTKIKNFLISTQNYKNISFGGDNIFISNIKQIFNSTLESFKNHQYIYV
ncbi:AAC(3) family N-acetyltransferase [Campylobacter armoricus]|uniref:Aminoglycoside N(3)-acetyltransferase n=1 Tax=Campylobacter armoricus TaxID=2505970 RepID=A0A7L5I7W0_9BACT|nr:AAC(3) family N-acetyltransferase [Campylobacter armoricus]QKF80230.1 aminoglycoside N3'-acetyltransferase [Campylobacter armoricus]